MRIRLAIPDHLVSPEVLEAALETTALANERAIADGQIPTLTDAIKKGGVRWKPEPFTDGEHFDLADQVVQRKWGDCDDLAPWLAGELRASGQDPGARPRVYQTGPKRWHVVTELSDGRILDPSKWAGMKGGSGDGVSGTLAKPFARPYGGALAVMPDPDHRAWSSRVDLPWPDALGHMASHAQGATPELALARAAQGAICCGLEMDSPLTDRAIACAQLLLARAAEAAEMVPQLTPHVIGTGPGELHARWLRASPEERAAMERAFNVGPMGPAFVKQLRTGKRSGVDPGKLLKGAAALAAPFVPGGGLATTALSALTHGGGRQSGARAPGAIVHPSGGVSIPIEREAPENHDQHMFITYHPAGQVGPVVMRF